MKNLSTADGVLRVLKADRFLLADGSLDVIKRDIETVLEEYFVINGETEIKIQPFGEGYKILIEVNSPSIKSFKKL